MKKMLLIMLMVVSMTAVITAGNWTFDGLFVDFALVQSDAGGVHGVTVDPNGNIWIAMFGALGEDSITINDTLKYFTRPLWILDAAGNHVSFSPLTIIEFADGSKDTLHAAAALNGSARGISIDNDGNILYSSFATLYKINYATGAGMAKYEAPGSITDAAVDDAGNVFLGRVGAGNPLVILDSDLVFQSNAVDTIPWLARSLEVSGNGEEIYYATIWNAVGIVHFNSSAPGFLKYEIVDTLGNFKDVPDMANDTTRADVPVWASSVDWGPNGNLWLGILKSAFSNSGDYGSRWFVYDVANDTYVDTVGIALGDSSAGGVLSPRGATWSNDGATLYLADFDYSVVARYSRVTGVSDEPKNLLATYALKQNYPNPFNPSTRIPFEIQQSGNVTLVVYDLLGRQVEVLKNDEFMNAGSHTIEFNASSLASGVYIYRLTVNGNSIAKKMMFLK
ncbi:MAG: T9SS type A sorting domain-containing protein [Candidatus Marinimicrobia bacterium]|nr:T9SS type A sorting domain-containing protein [Candidatus Neomarinimicrobiota bacterium]